MQGVRGVLDSIGRAADGEVGGVEGQRSVGETGDQGVGDRAAALGFGQDEVGDGRVFDINLIGDGLPEGQQLDRDGQGEAVGVAVSVGGGQGVGDVALGVVGVPLRVRVSGSKVSPAGRGGLML